MKLDSGETTYEIIVPIINKLKSPHVLPDDDIFGVRLFNPTGGANLKLKSQCFVNVYNQKSNESEEEKLERLENALKTLKGDDSEDLWRNKFVDSIVLKP